MSLKPRPSDPIPDETRRVALAVFPKGNRYLRLRDKFGELFTDELFTDLFSTRGQPAEAPGRLALVTVMQFAEGLSDRQAADAVRSRIDWKYALGLPLEDPGFDASVLVEFRGRLLEGGVEAKLLDTLLIRFRDARLLKTRGRQRTDSTSVLAAIHTLNRLECVGETMRHALNVLAVAAPDWLRALTPPEWVERYGRRFDDYQLPQGKPERYALAETIGADGFRLLDAVYTSEAPLFLRELTAVQVLRAIWIQQFYAPNGPIRWRIAEDLPPATLAIRSPYDYEARFATKRHKYWTGYRVHFTETCDDDLPRLITDVQTTTAPISDYELLPSIRASLATKDLLPAEHLADGGYVSVEQLLASVRDYGTLLIGPVNEATGWHSRVELAYTIEAFQIDWDNRTVTCPQGKTTTIWRSVLNSGKPSILTRFKRSQCDPCPVRERCTRSKTTPRTLIFRPRESFEALQAARRHQKTEAYRKAYAARAGMEGTLSHGVRTAGLRRSKYIGLAKTHLQHLLTAAAINVQRVADWLAGLPLAQSRRSSFTALMTA